MLGEIGPDGQISKDTALRAFSLAFGPMPGVTVPRGPVGVIRSGTGALRWLISKWSEITDAQRAAAIRLVPELAGPDTEPSTGSSFLHVATGPPPVHPPSFWLAIAKAKAQLITDALGGAPTLGLTLDVAEGAVQQATSAAETIVLNAAGGKSGAAAKCVIRISPGGATQDPDVLQNMIAHEVWHCFEGQVIGVDAFGTRPSWSMEGEAEWVGNTVAPTIAPDAEWDEYVLDPGKGLFSRSYDAMGFFAHIDDGSLYTWQRLIPVLTEGADNAAAFAAAGATSNEFLDTWASSYFRQPPYGKAWVMKGPGLAVDVADVPLTLAVGSGDTAKFDAGAYANSISVLSSTADVLVFDVSGHVRLGDPGTKQDYVIQGTSTFCTKSGGCECPPGTVFAGAPPNPLSADSVLAASSGADATTGTVTGVPLDEFCTASGLGATWHFDSPARYSGGTSHAVVDAYTCTTLQGPWTATLHATHDPATSRDPKLDRLVKFAWTFDRNGRATPTVGPYDDTVYGTTHSITYYPVLQLDKAARTITVVSIQGSEDGSPRIDVDYQLGRVGEAVPLTIEKPSQC